MIESYININSKSTVSKKYKHITTSDFVEPLKTLGFELHTVTEARVRNIQNKGFQKHIARFRSKDIMPSVNEQLFPEIVIVNNHMGSGSVRLMIGFYRLVCANGITIGDTFEEIRIRHTGNPHKQIYEELPKIAAKLKDLSTIVNKMKNTQLNETDIIKFAKGVFIKKAGINDSTVDQDYSQLLTTRRQEDTSSDLFTVLNVIQENIIRFNVEINKIKENKILTTKSRKVKEGSLSWINNNSIVWNEALKLVA